MSRIGSRRRLALIGLTVALALVLTSCFGGEDEPEEPTTTTAEQVAPLPPTTPADSTPEVVTPEPPPPPPPEDTVVFDPPPPPPDPPEPPQQDPPVNDDGIVLYTVESGDTLFSIAQRFGVTLDDLVQANNISNPDVILEGDTLTIPLDG